MKTKKNLGNYLLRNGEKIQLEKEEEYFTVIINNEEELDQVRSISGIIELKAVQNRLFKVRVSEDKRDSAMVDGRSEKVNVVCHHAYRPKGGKNTRYYLTEQIVVKFKENVSRKKIGEIILTAGLRLLREYPGSHNTFLLQVTINAGMNPVKVANTLAEFKEVVYAEPNLVNRFQNFYIPTDSYFDQQWHLKSWNGPDLVEEADVSATEAWDITRGSRDVVVAVIDDGFDLTHPDFTGQGKVVHPKDYVDGDSNPFPVSSHNDYHGTPCAGVAIAEENGQGVLGVAPGCAFMPVRFPLSADDNFLWEIFDFVGKHADVISCSWGPPPVNAPLGQLLTDKFHQLALNGGPRKKGCLIIFAAGNYNAPLNDPANTSFEWYHSQYGLRVSDGPILNGGAAHPDVMAVAASTSLNRKSAYSNWGKEISISSPSNNFHPISQNTPVPGRGIWTTDNEAYGYGFTSGSRFTGHFGGTSSATPLAAGVAALVISINDNLTASEVRQILEDTADKIIDNNPDPVLNLTKGNYDANGHSEWFGYGKVNAAMAVKKAKELMESTTGITELKLEALSKSNLPGQNAEELYKFKLGSKVSVKLTGPENKDFDLYVQKGSVPTTTDYDARGYTGSANEKVTINSAGPGEYFIMVRSYQGSGDYELKVEFED